MRGSIAAAMRGWLRGVLVALGCMLANAAWVQEARACSCMQIAPADAARGASAVFEGRVLAITPDTSADDQGIGGNSTLRVRMAVVRSWKGVQAETIEVRTPGNSAACGYPFALDESYLVYAAGELADLQVSLCSRTQSMAGASAEPDLRHLGMGTVPFTPAKATADPPPVRPTPAQGGCASCTITTPRSTPPLLLLASLALLTALRLRRRRR